MKVKGLAKSTFVNVVFAARDDDEFKELEDIFNKLDVNLEYIIQHDNHQVIISLKKETEDK